jgi:hypothetical protein
VNLALLDVDAGDANTQAQIDLLRSIEVNRMDKHLVSAGSANEVALRKARSVIGCHVLGRQDGDRTGSALAPKGVGGRCTRQPPSDDEIVDH